MPFTLLYIRLKQIQQEIKSLGLYLLLIIIAAFYLIIVAYKQFEKGQNALYIIAAMTIICLGIQASRKDKVFIRKQVHWPHLQMFLEYTALTFPIAITSVITRTWYCFPLLLSLLILIPYVNFTYKKSAVFKNLSSVIPASNFEWISGIRKSYLLVIILYLSAIATSAVRVLPLFLLWFLTVIFLSFYSEAESIQILRESKKTSNPFLLNKLFKNWVLLFILYIPVIILNTVFNTDFWLINSLFIPVQISLLSFAICLKYSSYVPGKNQKGNSILISILALSSALPYLLPIPVFLSIIYFFKATRNLNKYLNDSY